MMARRQNMKDKEPMEFQLEYLSDCSPGSNNTSPNPSPRVSRPRAESTRGSISSLISQGRSTSRSSSICSIAQVRCLGH